MIRHEKRATRMKTPPQRRSDLYDAPWLMREVGGAPVWFVIVLSLLIVGDHTFALLSPAAAPAAGSG